jgi:hypothetical protein
MNVLLMGRGCPGSNYGKCDNKTAGRSIVLSIVGDAMSAMTVTNSSKNMYKTSLCESPFLVFKSLRACPVGLLTATVVLERLWAIYRVG